MTFSAIVVAVTAEKAKKISEEARFTPSDMNI